MIEEAEQLIACPRSIDMNKTEMCVFIARKKRNETAIASGLCGNVGEFNTHLSSLAHEWCVRGSYSARVPRSSLARVHREFVHHILEDEVDGQEEGQDDKREDSEQGEESGIVEKSRNKHMSA